MPASRQGVATNGARSPALTVSRPVDGDAANAASVQAPLDTIADYVAYLQAHGALIDLANVYTQSNTFSHNLIANGQSGDSQPALQTTSAPASSSRKLLWDASCAGSVRARAYAAYSNNAQQGGWEFTVNGRWNSSTLQWELDSTSPFPAKLEILPTSTNNFAFKRYNSTSSFTEASWSDVLYLNPIPTSGGTVLSSGGLTISKADGVSASGTMHAVAMGGAYTSAANQRIYGTIVFRKAFPAVASSVTLPLAGSTYTNIANGGSPVGYTIDKLGEYGHLLYGQSSVAGNASFFVYADVA